ncbi:MAG: pyridoxal phosphate-dependent aminotransferase [Desulfobacterales bacterium]|nr:pyridoxal phosphate-dependent aminotransferase [Desulfobacterales bacterium]
MNLSKRATQIEPSRTARFIPAMAELRRQGREVINFAVGEPDFPTPRRIIEATQKAMAEGHTRYGPTAGLPELRRCIARRFAGGSAENIVITNGSKQALYLIFQAICDPGDQVIIPSPCWVSFPEQVRLAGAEPVMVASLGHRLDAGAVAAAVTPRTRAVLVNSPNNPTGAVYTEDELAAIVALCMEKDLFLLSDEAYDAFVYDGGRHVSPFDWTGARDRVIVTRSFSKPFAMTGFRVGYAAAPVEVARAMEKILSHASGNVCTFVQHGALAALEIEETLMPNLLARMSRRRDIAYGLASNLFDCLRPEGAFYLFADISGRLKTGETAEAFCMGVLDKTGVAMVPGEAFGAPGFVRISYAVAEDRIGDGFERIRKFLQD